MFFRGSRYRNLRQSVHITAKGESVVSVELRPIPTRRGQFSHTLSGRERLDLLAYRYYSDPTRWWQIADANPEFPFPLDLVDTAPVAFETFAVVHPAYEQSVAALAAALSALGALTAGPVDFACARMTLVYAPGATRAQVLGQLTAQGFLLRSSFAWLFDASAAEAFVFEARQVNLDWQALLSALRGLPGVTGVVPEVEGGKLDVSYNEAAIVRESLVAEIRRHHFDVAHSESQKRGRAGKLITIPPNQVG